MKTRPLSAFYFGTIRPVMACFFFIIIMTAAPPTYGEEAELLSDKCIDEITAGTVSGELLTNLADFVTTFIETPSYAEIGPEPQWWGDMDGFPLPCQSQPGFLVTKIPYDDDYQYDTFKYSFDSQEALDNFVKALSSGGGDPPVNIIDTDFIKSNPSAEQAFLNDGRNPQVREIIITTDRKVDSAFVRDYGGEVITQSVRFEMEFLEPYLKSYTIHSREGKKIGVPVLAYSPEFRNHIRYEWLTRQSPTGWATRSETYGDVTYNFGALFLDTGIAGPGGILSESGNLVVPEGQTYVKSTIFNDVRVYCPDFAMGIGLAPQGAAIPPELVSGDQTHEPDMDRYQELGRVHIKNLAVYVSGGNDIYIYANEELDTCP